MSNKIQSTKLKNKNYLIIMTENQEIWKKHNKITKNIIYSMINNFYPITKSELKLLKNILKINEPNYQLPNEKKIYDVLIPHLYYQLKNKISAIIKYDLIRG